MLDHTVYFERRLTSYDSDYFYPNQVFFSAFPFQPCQVLSQARHFDRWQNALEREQGAQISLDSGQRSFVLHFAALRIMQNDGSKDMYSTWMEHIAARFEIKFW